METDAIPAKVVEYNVQLKSSEGAVPEKIDRYLGKMSGSWRLVDLVASTFSAVPLTSAILEEIDLNQRLRLLSNTSAEKTAPA